jgi:iron complex transport system permease protein
MRNKRRYKHWILSMTILLLLLLAVSFFSLTVGSVVIPLKKIIAFLLHPDGSIEYSIVSGIRLPRIILGIAVGGALSVAGVLLQGMFRNPLVEPYTLGISGGAALGVSLNILTGFYKYSGAMSLTFSGFAGSLAVVFLVYNLSFRKSIFEMQGVLLTGVMISFISSALIMLIMSVSRAEDLHGIVFWIMGSLGETDRLLVSTALVISVAGSIMSYFFCLDLNALSLGEEGARHLGIRVEKRKRILFLIASVLTGMSVSVAGIIGFIGLVVPHFVRMFIGSDHRILIVASYLSGAIFLILCDTIARTIILPLELPVGVISGIAGGTLFIYAIVKRGTLR